MSITLEMLGDRWSFLIVRDLMVRGHRTFKEFQESGEGIATNVLAARLRRLRVAGIVETEPDRVDRRKINYRLTDKGIDLAPVLLELLIWGARHEETMAPRALIEKVAQNREAFLAETRRRWRDRDPAPLLPRFRDARPDAAERVDSEGGGSSKPLAVPQPAGRTARRKIKGERAKKRR